MISNKWKKALNKYICKKIFHTEIKDNNLRKLAFNKTKENECFVIIFKKVWSWFGGQFIWLCKLKRVIVKNFNYISVMVYFISDYVLYAKI